MFSCDTKVSQPPTPLPDNFPYKLTTPQGAKVFSVVAIPNEALTSIDSGLNIQINSAKRFYNWSKFQKASDYTIRFIEPQVTNQDGSPAIFARGIQTAGTTFGTGRDGSYPPTIVLPHQSATNWRYANYLIQSARNESEHVAESENDLTLFFQRANANDCHPHFPQKLAENWCGYFDASKF